MARAVNAAADVIHRAQVNGTQTATGLAIALESAQLLQSPETARELERLRARVAELEAARNGSRPGGHSHPEADDVSLQVRKLRALLAGQRAVREARCLKPPIGCGKPLITEDGTGRVFWDEAEAACYQAEWRITGLCPDCQDALDDGGGA